MYLGKVKAKVQTIIPSPPLAANTDGQTRRWTDRRMDLSRFESLYQFYRLAVAESSFDELVSGPDLEKYVVRCVKACSLFSCQPDFCPLFMIRPSDQGLEISQT